MPQSEPVTILLVNAIAEEIKLATLNFRRFFPNCRVDAVYTVEEALQWGHRASWQLILIDEALLTQPAAPIFLELRQLAPSATLVLQTDHSDSTAASGRCGFSSLQEVTRVSRRTGVVRKERARYTLRPYDTQPDTGTPQPSHRYAQRWIV
jgi:hypothetical protein